MQAFAPLNRADLGSLTREPGSVAHDSRALSGRPWPPDPRAPSLPQIDLRSTLQLPTACTRNSPSQRRVRFADFTPLCGGVPRAENVTRALLPPLPAALRPCLLSS